MRRLIARIAPGVAVEFSAGGYSKATPPPVTPGRLLSPAGSPRPLDQRQAREALPRHAEP